MSSREKCRLRQSRTLDRTAVELNGLLVLALHLQFVGFLKVISRGLPGIVVGHKGPKD